MNLLPNLFDLAGRVAVITGGTGLLGIQYARAIALAGGVPVLVDVHNLEPHELRERLGFDAQLIIADITDQNAVTAMCEQVLAGHNRIDILINNAANNPKVENKGGLDGSRLENFSIRQWNDDLAVGLTGALLCSRTVGAEMARRGGGVIVNIASDLALIGPDQRLYRKDGLADDMQPVKPVSYSVVKTGLIGLTRYLATYWAAQGVRVNALSPGGVENGQPAEFLQRISKLIPMGRMAGLSEYQGAILFLCSDASSYMTGTNLVIDGGRSCW